MISSLYKLNKVFLICPIYIFLFCCQLTAQNENSVKVKSAVDKVRIDYEKIIQRKIPSLNVLIQTPEENIFVSSVPDGSTPITKDTYFRFASNTKNFTSASILNMQEEGWLDIKSKITDNIPGSSMPYIPNTTEFDIPYKNE
ncbi:MAG: serine hydrolase, partial [bacterium]